MKKSNSAHVPIRALVLRAIAAGGGATIALMAPKMTRLLKEFDSAKIHRDRLYGRIRQALTRLEQQGFIVGSGVHGDRKYRLTEKGRALAHEAEADSYRIPEPTFWDGKWRVMAFDITERRRKVRVQLRNMLQNAGFFRLQDSLWIYPYPCEEFLGLIRAHLKSGVGELRFFVAETLEADRALREHFKLI